MERKGDRGRKSDDATIYGAANPAHSLSSNYHLSLGKQNRLHMYVIYFLEVPSA